jgi:hypothetical protein
MQCELHLLVRKFTARLLKVNPYPANVENMVSS